MQIYTHNAIIDSPPITFDSAWRERSAAVSFKKYDNLRRYGDGNVIKIIERIVLEGSSAGEATIKRTFGTLIRRLLRKISAAEQCPPDEKMSPEPNTTAALNVPHFRR